MSDKLLPCPFCGCRPRLDYEHMYTEDVWFVWCACAGTPHSCGAKGAIFGSYEANYKQRAIDAWNTRSDNSQELIDKLAEVREFIPHLKPDCPETYDAQFIAKAPLMIDIIKHQQDDLKNAFDANRELGQICEAIYGAMTSRLGLDEKATLGEIIEAVDKLTEEINRQIKEPGE